MMMMKKTEAASSSRNPTATRRRIHDDNNRILASNEISGRSIDSCRARSRRNHLPFTEAEDEIIIWAHSRLGDNWTAIAGLLSGRTSDAIMNRWNATLSRSPTNPSASIGRDLFNSTPPPPAAVGCSSSVAIERGEDDPMTRLTLTPLGYDTSDRREVYDKKAEVHPLAAVGSSSFVPIESGEEDLMTRLTLTPLGYDTSDRREVYGEKAEVHPPAAVGFSAFVAIESGEDDPMTRLTLAPLGYRRRPRQEGGGGGG